MSIILKGIDLPKENLRVICLFPNGAEELVVLDADSGATAGRPIQVIQIPKGHGRLIDADALETVFKDMAKCEWNQKAFPISWAYAFEDTIDKIEDAPTILEAEEE
jgi:hypothetical protein